MEAGRYSILMVPVVPVGAEAQAEGAAMGEEAAAVLVEVQVVELGPVGRAVLVVEQAEGRVGAVVPPERVRVRVRLTGKQPLNISGADTTS